MNADRRAICLVTIALLEECSHHGEIGDRAVQAVEECLKHLQRTEYHQLRTQEKHEGKNASTDSQIAISRVALPALEEALRAWEADDFDTVVQRLHLAVTTDGKTDG